MSSAHILVVGGSSCDGDYFLKEEGRIWFWLVFSLFLYESKDNTFNVFLNLFVVHFHMGANQRYKFLDKILMWTSAYLRSMIRENYKNRKSLRSFNSPIIEFSCVIKQTARTCLFSGERTRKRARKQFSRPRITGYPYKRAWHTQ